MYVIIHYITFFWATYLARLTFDSVFRVPCTSFPLIVVVLKTSSCVLEKGLSRAACQCASLKKCLLLFLMLVDELWYCCCSVCSTRWSIASYSPHFVSWSSTTTPVFITFIFSLKAIQYWTHLEKRNSTANQSSYNDNKFHEEGRITMSCMPVCIYCYKSDNYKTMKYNIF